MAWIIPSSVITSGTAISVAPADNLFVGVGITLGSTDGFAVVLAWTTGQRAIVNGALVGAIGGIANSGILDETRVVFGTTAQITGLTAFGAGFTVFNNFNLVNRGLIESFGGPLGALYLVTGTDVGESVVRNFGTIRGDDTGVLLDGLNPMGPTLFNSGVIDGGVQSLRDIGTQIVTTVVNSGTMIGGVLLGTGNDAYLGTGGRVVGSVSGEGGDDSLTGGSLRDTLLGGDGNDTLSGARGQDVLTGGAGADRFVFGAAPGPANRDTITDFRVGDRILLDDAVFRALDPGTLAPSAFRAGTTGLALDATDRILFETDTRLLRYDPDGVGGAAAQVLAVVNGNAVTAASFTIF